MDHNYIRSSSTADEEVKRRHHASKYQHGLFLYSLHAERCSSDAVSFTKLAGRGAPLQVVNLLYSLYTMFDSISTFDMYDVYNVETIGDSYLCVSGLPRGNGQEHVKEICNMPLEFMNSLANFKYHICLRKGST